MDFNKQELEYMFAAIDEYIKKHGIRAAATDLSIVTKIQQSAEQQAQETNLDQN